MKQIEIIKIQYIKDYILELEFSDSCSKQFDFLKLITFNGIAEKLKNIEYFKNVKIINNGRAIAWENDYDCCADWIRYYAMDLQNEWIGYDDDFDLKKRIKVAQKKLQQAGNIVTS